MVACSYQNVLSGLSAKLLERLTMLPLPSDLPGSLIEYVSSIELRHQVLSALVFVKPQ